MPEIAIVIPAFRSAPYIARTIDSVIAQSFTDWHLIVVDDASPDDTADIVRRYTERDERIQLLALPSNGGAANARNLGLAASPETPYVIFLDGDDEWEPHALAALRAALHQHPEAVAAHGLARTIGPQGEPFYDGRGVDILSEHRPTVDAGRWRILGPHEPTTFASLVVSNDVPTPGLALIRKAVLDREGPAPFDQAIWPTDDWDLWLRLLRHGPMAFVPRVTLRYRRHPTQAWWGGTDGSRRAADLRMRRAMVERIARDEGERRLARDGWRYAERRVLEIQAERLAAATRGLRVRTAARLAPLVLLAYVRSRRWYPVGMVRRALGRGAPHRLTPVGAGD